MKQILRGVGSNLNRAFLCPRFLLCVAIGLAIEFMGIWDVITMQRLNVAYLFFWLMQMGTFQILLLCVPAMVYSDSFLEDMKGSFVRFSVQRCGVNGYLVSKYIATVISGFVVMFVSCALFVAILYLRFPLGDYGDFMNIADVITGSSSRLIAEGDVFGYLALGVLRQGVCGAFYAGMALACSTFIDNSFVVIAAPVLLGQWSETIRDLLGMKYSLSDIQFGTTKLIDASEAASAALTLFVPLTLVCGMIFLYKGRKRVYEAI